MQEDPAEHPLEVSCEDLLELQKTDESLKPVWRQVQGEPRWGTLEGRILREGWCTVSHMDASQW